MFIYNQMTYLLSFLIIFPYIQLILLLILLFLHDLLNNFPDNIFNMIRKTKETIDMVLNYVIEFFIELAENNRLIDPTY